MQHLYNLSQSADSVCVVNSSSKSGLYNYEIHNFSVVSATSYTVDNQQSIFYIQHDTPVFIVRLRLLQRVLPAQ